MRGRVDWTAEMDARLRGLRQSGATWDKLAADMELSRDIVIERARRIGARAVVAAPGGRGAFVTAEARDRAARGPGHPSTWQALTAGTSLEGAAYPFPVFL